MASPLQLLLTLNNVKYRRQKKISTLQGESFDSGSDDSISFRKRFLHKLELSKQASSFQLQNFFSFIPFSFSFN
jgi:hypothetical protein